MQVVLLKDESGVILTDGECDVHDDVPVQAMSKEDRRTHAQSVEYLNCHYELPLPWRYGD